MFFSAAVVEDFLFTFIEQIVVVSAPDVELILESGLLRCPG
jgi:hypothetical protein